MRGMELLERMELVDPAYPACLTQRVERRDFRL